MKAERDNSISYVTRQAIFDALRNYEVPWWGRLSEVEFLSRIFDVASLPTTDHRSRHETAADDITRHRQLNPNDWPDDWVFDDSRFNLAHCPDETFLAFLTSMVHPEVQPDIKITSSLERIFNQNLQVDGWEIAKRSEISGKPVFNSRRLQLHPDKPANEDIGQRTMSENNIESTVEGILATLTDLFAYDGAAKEVAILANAEAELVQTEYDNWNGGTYGYTLYLRVPTELYTQVYSECESLGNSIRDKGKPLFTDNAHLSAVSILPIQTVDPKWRDKAKAWLAGGGVNNQGRVRSDNIASRECDGLLFRSQPEINLYKALKSVGVSFAPLPVFIRGGQTYRRIEPDFVVIKDGMVVVVEVDGDTVHRELPAEAHDRTTILEHEGARIIRILASKCETPELATQYAKELLGVIEKLKRSQS